MNEVFDPREAFADPVGWLARYGIAAELVIDLEPVPEAA